MKAVVLPQTGGPEQLRIEEYPTPTAQAGQVRVALQASALNRRDVWITLARYPGIRLPCILGSDGAGIVDQVGAGVDADWLGREVVVYPAYDWGDDPRYPSPNFRVLGMPDPGTFAEYICLPSTQVFPKPAHLNWGQAAALPLAGLTAWRAVVTQAGLRPGETVLITGIGGGVATFALKWACALQAHAWVSSSSQVKIKQALRLGAIGGVNYREPNWSEQLLAQTGGVDVIIDGTGGASFNRYLALIKGAGRIVVYGATAGNPDKGLEMARLFFRQAQIRGTTMGSMAEFASLLDCVAAHRIEPVVYRVFSLEEAVLAHQHLAQAAQMGKIVLRHS